MTSKKQQAELFDAHAEIYDEVLSESTAWFEKDVDYFARYKVEQAAKLACANIESLLEFGCGTGRNLGYLREFFPNSAIYACDVSEKSLSSAKERYPEVTFFAENYSCYSEKFDLIFVAGVFHHIPISERVSVLNTLKAMLKRYGKIIIFEHNSLNPFVRRVVRKCPLDKGAVLLPMQSLERLLLETSYSLLRKGYCVFFPSSLGWFRKYEMLLSSCPLGGQYYVFAEKNKKIQTKKSSLRASD